MRQERRTFFVVADFQSISLQLVLLLHALLP
jgi:hypothetical protein